MKTEEGHTSAQVDTARGLLTDLKFSMDAVARSRAPMVVKIKTRSGYSTLRLISGLIRIIGGLLVMLSTMGLIAVLFTTDQTSVLGEPSLMMILVSIISFLLTGLFFVVVGQIMVAVADTADYARQSLILQKAIAENRIEVDTRTWL